MALFAALLLVLLVAGCNGDAPEPAAPPEEEATPEPAEAEEEAPDEEPEEPADEVADGSRCEAPAGNATMAVREEGADEPTWEPVDIANDLVAVTLEADDETFTVTFEHAEPIDIDALEPLGWTLTTLQEGEPDFIINLTHGAARSEDQAEAGTWQATRMTPEDQEEAIEAFSDEGEDAFAPYRVDVDVEVDGTVVTARFPLDQIDPTVPFTWRASAGMTIPGEPGRGISLCPDVDPGQPPGEWDLPEFTG